MNVGDWSFLEQITELLAQLIVFLFQLGAEGFNFLKGPRIRDAHGGMIGEDPQPLKILITEHAGVTAIPVSAFYDEPGAPTHYARFAFCKKPEVLDEALARLRRHFSR